MNMARMILAWMTAPARAVRVLVTVSILVVPSSAFSADDQAKSDAQENKIRDSVVKISATMRVPDLTHPWTKQSSHEASGTGVVIDGKRILTNAHVVL
jgi:S1-C subfamily serine protease